MSANFLNKLAKKIEKPAESPRRPAKYWLYAIVVVLWTLLGFGVAQVIVAGLLYALSYVGVPLAAINETLFTSVGAALIYMLALALLLLVPWWVKKYRTTRRDMGLTRPMSWGDIGLAPLGFVVYLLISASLVFAAGQLLPSIDLTQAQETGFEHVSQYYQYLLVFITLVILAPVAEEMIFRGYLYGKLRKFVPLWAAMLVTSLVFGAVHGQWNVAIDVFALSLILCTLREITGNIWAGMLLHMLKNGIAFFVLFIYPLLSHTIGG